MVWSHSKINLVLEDVFSYFLRYYYKVEPVKKSNALLIGSAVHHGLELDNSDLSDYFRENGSFEQKNAFSPEQMLAEAMVTSYLAVKDDILSDIIGDSHIKNIYREQEYIVPLEKTKSEFLGIIDLLIETDKGWIVVDYKTTSKTPNYDDYLEQLYRYCFLLEKTYPDIPIYKIAIISLKKASIRQKFNESPDDFKRRLILLYREQGSEYISYHIFNKSEDKVIFNPEVLKNYYNNLENLISLCEKIISYDKFPVNYSKALNIYGNSPYFDLIYFNKEKAQANLYVRDYIYNEDLNEIEYKRDLNEVDFVLIEQASLSVLNKSIIHYDHYKSIIENKDDNIENYIYDPELIKKYQATYNYELKNN